MNGIQEAEIECRTMLDTVKHPFNRERLHATLSDILQVKQQAFKQLKLAEGASPPQIPANGSTISPFIATGETVVKREPSSSFSSSSPSRSSGTLQSPCGFATQAAAPVTLPRPPSTSDNSGGTTSSASLNRTPIEHIHAASASMGLRSQPLTAAQQNLQAPLPSSMHSDSGWPQDQAQRADLPNGSSGAFAPDMSGFSLNQQQSMLDDMEQIPDFLRQALAGDLAAASGLNNDLGYNPSLPQFGGHLQNSTMPLANNWANNMQQQQVPQWFPKGQLQQQGQLLDPNSYGLKTPDNYNNNRIGQGGTVQRPNGIHHGLPNGGMPNGGMSNGGMPNGGMPNGGMMHGRLQGSNGDSFSHRMEVARANRGYNNTGNGPFLNGVAPGPMGQLPAMYVPSSLTNHNYNRSLPMHPWGVDLQKGELDAMGSPLFRPLTTYSWEQSDSLVKIYVPLRGVQTNLLRATFTSTSVEVRVVALQGRNYIYQIKSLYMPINSDGCHVAASKTKKNVLITLQKLCSHAQEAKHWRDLSYV